MRNIFGYLFLFFLLSCGSDNTSVKSAKSVTEQTIDSSKLFVVSLFDKGVEQTVFDTIKLGRLQEGESVESYFFVQNKSSKSTVITSIVTGCGCASGSYDKKPMVEGDKRLVTVTYNSKGQFGTQLKAVDIVTSDFAVGRIFISCTVVD